MAQLFEHKHMSVTHGAISRLCHSLYPHTPLRGKNKVFGALPAKNRAGLVIWVVHKHQPDLNSYSNAVQQ